jgi:GAF domain/ANTAR domain
MGGGLAGVLSALCELAITTIPVSGASVTLVSNDGIAELLCSTDGVAAKLAELQFALGEGPGPESLRLARSVLLHDLEQQPVRDSAGQVLLMPSLVEAARDLGAGSLLAFPLRVGAVRLGVLELYVEERNALGDVSVARAQQLADAVTHALLSLAGASEDGLPNPGDDGSHQRAVVHQATGMVMVQLGVPIGDAFVRLRAHAFATGATVTEISSAIVARELRLERDDGLSAEGGEAGHDET